MPSSGTHSDQHSRSRSFAIRKAVLVKNFGNGPKWLRGRITHCIGPLSYRVFLRDGRSVRRYVDHLQPHHVRSSDLPDPNTDDYSDVPSLPTSPRHSQRNCGPPSRYAPYVWGGK